MAQQPPQPQQVSSIKAGSEGSLIERKGYKGVSLPIHRAPFSENHQFRQDSRVLFFSNHGSPWLYHFNQVGVNGGMGS